MLLTWTQWILAVAHIFRLELVIIHVMSHFAPEVSLCIDFQNMEVLTYIIVRDYIEVGARVCFYVHPTVDFLASSAHR